MKTILEWLSEIEDVEVRVKAIRNLRIQTVRSDREVESLEIAITEAFIFAITPEGNDYWWIIREKLKNK